MRKLLVTCLLLASCSSAGVVKETPDGIVWQTTTTIPQQISVVAVGDIACSSSQRESTENDCQDIAVAKLASGMNPDFVFALGDIQYNSHGSTEFELNFGTYWASLLSITKPIAGNHEYGDGKAEDFFSTWGNIPRSGYYSFEVGDKWLVVALNTNDECTFVSCSKGSDQYLWLQQQLASNTDRCVIALGHHPRYSSGAHGDTEAVNDIYGLMSQYEVSMYISGHDHHYERFETNRSPKQYVVGTGGRSLRGVWKQSEHSASIIDDKYGVLVLDISGSVIRERFVGLAGETLDSDTTVCYR